MTKTSTSLPLNHINIVILTDVHSWVAGHAYHEPDMNADYGHVLSFYQHLQKICREQGKDLFFVMNGDFIHGTALGNNLPSLLIPILEQMPWDALNMGDHELFYHDTIEYISKPSGFIDHWKGKYITSNVRLVNNVNETTLDHNNEHNIGSKFRFMRGEFGSQVLTFGFLYDMTREDKSTTVDKVEDVVREPWFHEVLKGTYGGFDAILVLAHMDVDDPLVHVILNAVRNICGDDIPIQFITGHSHIQSLVNLDDKSVSLQAGRFLDTVGFASFSNKGEFKHEFIPANTLSMALYLDLNDKKELDTPDGKALSAMIDKTQREAGLLDVLACSPQNFYLNRTTNQADSLFGIYLKEAVPNYLFDGNSSKIMIHERHDFWYDLHKGNITVTDLVSVSPLNHEFYLIAETVSGSTILSSISDLNKMDVVPSDPIYKALASQGYMVSGEIIENNKEYDVYTIDFHVNAVKNTLEKWIPEKHNGLIPTVAFPLSNPLQVWMDFFDDNWICPFSNQKLEPNIQISTAVVTQVGIIGNGGGTLLYSANPDFFNHFYGTILLCISLFMLLNKRRRNESQSDDQPILGGNVQNYMSTDGPNRRLNFDV